MNQNGLGESLLRPKSNTAIISLWLLFNLIVFRFLQTTVLAEKHSAVLHVGPHKTGTSAIQSSTYLYKYDFNNDSYVVVDFDDDIARNKHGYGKPTRNLAMCSCPSKQSHYSSCNEEFLRLMGVLMPRNKNLILSHEGLDYECVDVEKIAKVLKPWNVKVVVTYRRFFQWVSSFFFQTHRVDTNKTSAGKKSTQWPPLKKKEANITVNNIVKFLSVEKIQRLYDSVYTTSVHSRYRRIFEDVSIMNYHDERDIVEVFFCSQVPNATHTCNELKKKPKSPPNPNLGGSTVYDELTVAAYRANFFSSETNLTRPQVRNLIQKRQEVNLNLTVDDFPKACMSQDQIDLLLKLSLQAERTLLPDFFTSPFGEVLLLDEFSKAINSKLCAVDYEKVLSDIGWSSFLRGLEGKHYTSSAYSYGEEQEDEQHVVYVALEDEAPDEEGQFQYLEGIGVQEVRNQPRIPWWPYFALLVVAWAVRFKSTTDAAFALLFFREQISSAFTKTEIPK